MTETEADLLELPAAPERAAAALRAKIFTGELPAGAPLREVALAASLDVSRNTLRNALRLLASEYLVDIRPNKGAVVKVMSLADIKDIYIVRRTVELKAVEESALASPRSLQRLRNAADSLDAAAHAEAWAEVTTLGLRFHQALVGMLGSPRLDTMFVTVATQIRLAYATVADEADFQAQFVVRDREICDLIVAGSRAAAAALLRQYLDDAERLVSEVVWSDASASSPAAGSVA